jgi:hypothetical protein
MHAEALAQEELEIENARRIILLATQSVRKLLVLYLKRSKIEWISRIHAELIINTNVEFGCCGGHRVFYEKKDENTLAEALF